MPPEIVSLVCSHVRRMRDMVALAMTASRLVTEPLFVHAGRLLDPGQMSRVIAAGAPLTAVDYLFNRWRTPLAVHHLTDAAEGGRLDVIEWLFERLTGRGGLEKNAQDENDDDFSDSDSSEGGGHRLPSATACGAGFGHSRRTWGARAAHVRKVKHAGNVYDSCSDSDTSTDSCDDSSSEDDNGSDRETRAKPQAAALATRPGQMRKRALPIARKCVTAMIQDVLMCAVRRGHAHIMQWALDRRIAGHMWQLADVDLERFKVEAASRGNVAALAMIHRHHPVPSIKVAAAALQADQMDIVEWIEGKKILCLPKMTPSLVGDLIADGRHPRFVRWAASRGHKADPMALVPLADRDNVDTLALVHDTGVCACTAEIVRAAARAGSLGVLKWAAGDDHTAPRVGAAWRPTDVAMLAATHRQREVIAWLHTRSDGRRALTAGVARAALAAGCVDVAAQIRPLGTWDAVEAAVASCDPNVVRAVVDAGGVCSPAAFASALRHGNAQVLAFLCERGGIAFLESALASLAGVECAPACIEWITSNPSTSHLCVAEAFAVILAKGEVNIEGTCRCAACTGLSA
ncbi:hypothetical protein pkur_cds_571 [Pandoravirus kuranda]|uniref:Ankyrin repeat domain containing protein n=1 Tax=Pandoravirus kuranda TaxID=3019033 RepID=A0AA95J6S3_9VIRU|nr:hypothetical protein pkur_cds_571 [Pandoravirus kuranda]